AHASTMAAASRRSRSTKAWPTSASASPAPPCPAMPNSTLPRSSSPRSPMPTSWPASSRSPPTRVSADHAAIPSPVATRHPPERYPMNTVLPTAEQLQRDWTTNPRWSGIVRNYGAEDVVRLRGSVHIEHSLARLGAEKLWKSLHEQPFVNALGALTGNQAMQQVKAGLKAIYLSGWQVAADANVAGEMYPDQSLYPANSVPQVVKRINNTLLRADQLSHAEGDDAIDYLQPIVADAEAGFGGVLNAFELMKAMIEAGAAGVHFEDQLASVKKCGHMGGKVLVPTREAIEKLIAARLAADVCGVPTLIVARTDAEAADLLTSDIDDNDKPFCTGERTPEGFFKTRKGLDQAISRGLA